MAINTKQKRFSALYPYNPWRGPLVYALDIGTTQGNRQAAIGYYSGILAEEIVIVVPDPPTVISEAAGRVLNLSNSVAVRASVPGVARPWARSHWSSDTRGPSWRQSVGLTYGGVLSDAIIPEDRNFRVRFGIGFQFGRGYIFGYGNSDPYFADPSEQSLPYIVEYTGLAITQSSQLELTIKRWSMAGTGRPYLRSNYPSALKDEAWRRSIGSAVGVVASQTDIDVTPDIVAISEEIPPTPTYTEEIV